MPADKIDFPGEYKKFWPVAHKADKVYSSNRDIYFNFKPSVDTYTWFANSEENNDITEIGIKYNLPLSTRYYFSSDEYKKYVKTYNVLNSVTQTFYKKRLLDLKKCLADNNNTIPLIDQY